MKSPIAILSLVALMAACGDPSLSSSPDQPDPPPVRKILEEVRVCVSKAFSMDDLRILFATGVMPRTGNKPRVTVRSDNALRSISVPPKARVRFIISKIIYNNSGPVNDVELRVENGDEDSTQEVLYFHEEGVTPYNENSELLEDCDEVDYYSDDTSLAEPPSCACDDTGNGCYLWMGGKGEPDALNYHCNDLDDFTCYTSEKGGGTGGTYSAICHASAEEVE